MSLQDTPHGKLNSKSQAKPDVMTQFCPELSIVYLSIFCTDKYPVAPGIWGMSVQASGRKYAVLLKILVDIRVTVAFCEGCAGASLTVTGRLAAVSGHRIEAPPDITPGL